ncbi:hypothetical protein [Microvirga yunnanensis]|uniref:hypothetical protein n=1 Tax=Microvirga yunnanensis TaxID=2953740 RepID=UPI0021C5DA12|nr:MULTISPECIES: hypothetical protein [unclassified Microvirga]
MARSRLAARITGAGHPVTQQRAAGLGPVRIGWAYNPDVSGFVEDGVPLEHLSGKIDRSIP